MTHQPGMYNHLVESRIPGLLPQPLISHVEDAIVGCAILDPSSVLLALEHVSRDDMMSPMGAYIWPIICDLHERGDPVDPIHIGHIGMADMGRWTSAGGMRQLMMADRPIPNAVLVIQYAQLHRKMRAEAELARAVAMSAESTGEEKAQALAEAMEAFHQTVKVERTGRDNDEVADDLLRRILVAASGKQSASAVETPFKDLTHQLGGGFHNGYVTVIAARPKFGKTAFAEQVAMVCARNGIGTLYYSQEAADAEEHMMRMAQKRGDFPFEAMRRGELTQGEAAAACKLVEEVRGLSIRWPVKLDVPKIDRILARLKLELLRWRKPYPCGLVIMDHLHEFKPARWLDKEHERIASVFSDIHSFASSSGLPVLLLAQMNRKIVDDSTGKTPSDVRLPNAGDLRGAGKIEESAAGVVFLHNPEKLCQRDETPKQRVEFVVDLARFGVRGRCEGKIWNGPRIRFENAPIGQGWT